MRRAIFGIAGAVLALLATPPAASADDTTCVGTLGPGTFDNVVVPENAFCELRGSLVTGSVKALPNSILSADSNTIRGNVIGDKARGIEVFDRPTTPGLSVVEGNIEAKEGGSGSGTFFSTFICGTRLPNGNIVVEKLRGPRNIINIGGDAVGGGFFFSCLTFGGINTLEKGGIKIEENVIDAAGELDVRNNSVAGNLQVFKNSGPGPKQVLLNTVGKNLQCFENAPLFLGTPNVAEKREGQCAP